MKRLLLMLLVLCVLISSQTVFATKEGTLVVEESTAQLTIEEILNDYQQKAFEEQTATKRETASAYSRNSNIDTKTLEQEVVETLRNAGYEAYNITSDNYNTLESELKTDFDKMGLNANDSYIIVISGDEESSNGTPNSRVGGSQIENDLGDLGGGGGNVFEHTHNGVTYTMRYITVTGGQNSALVQTSEIDLLDKYNVDDLWEDLNIPITIFSSLGQLPYTGTVYSLVAANMPNAGSVQPEKLEYEGGTNWTITYIQVYDFQNQAWELSAGFEYVTMRYQISHTYYEPSSNQVIFDNKSGDYTIEHSDNYYNRALLKNMAAYAFTNDTFWLDEITYVEYKFEEETVLKHWRWMEGRDYEPA